MPCCPPCADGNPCFSLGQAGTLTVAQCQADTGLPASTCQGLINATGGDPNTAYLLVRMAIIKAGAAGCAAGLEAQGIPKEAGLPLCNWAVDKVWKKFIEKIPAFGAPTLVSLVGGPENIYWRRCASPANLQLGEHWRPAAGGLPARCLLNIAILQQKDQPLRVVYVPCERLRTSASAVCRDRDGGIRPPGTKTPLYNTGFYGKRASDAWPFEFEQKPWVSPLAAIQIQPLVFQVVPPTPPPLKLPPESVAVFDSQINQFRILAPA